MHTDPNCPIQRGLALFEAQASPPPLVALWARAGHLQLRYLRLLKEVLSPTPGSPTKPLEWELLREDMIEFYGTEQTPASAQKNVALLLDPLREYWAACRLARFRETDSRRSDFSAIDP